MTEKKKREDAATDEARSADAVMARLEDGVERLLGRTRELARELEAERGARSALGADVDPVAMADRIERLEADNVRLAKHAAFLETSIRKLLSRVRYGSGR